MTGRKIRTHALVSSVNIINQYTTTTTNNNNNNNNDNNHNNNNDDDDGSIIHNFKQTTSFCLLPSQLGL